MDNFDVDEAHSVPKSDAGRAPLPEFFSQQVRQARRFYLDLAPPSDGPLTVVCGGSELCSPDYAIDRATFPYDSLEFVARGRGELQLNGRTHTLVPGSVFTYGPGVTQKITTDRDDPLLKYFVDFVGGDAVVLLERHALAPGTCSHVVVPGEIQDVFDALIRDGLKGTGRVSVLCAALLEYLLLKTADSLMPGEAGQSPAFLTYQRCRQHIVENCYRLKSLREVARECRVDRAYLCRLFRRYDNQTPHQFLTWRKMNLAAERLQTPGTLVKQVAEELGFDDPFHFSRSFKRVFGLSPEAFRQLR